MRKSKKYNSERRCISIVPRENEIIYDSDSIRLQVIKKDKEDFEVLTIKSVEEIKQYKKQKSISDITGIEINKELDIIIFMIIFGIGVFMTAFTPFYMQGICVCIIFIVIYLNCTLKDILELVKAIYKLKTKAKMQAKYNGAVNMVLNAYEELERIPTAEETKQFSIFNEKANIMVPITKICADIPFIIIVLSIPYIFEVLVKYNINSLWYFIIIPIEILIRILITIKGKKILKYLEIFLVSEPEDEQIKEVIYGVRRIENITKKIE